MYIFRFLLFPLAVLYDFVTRLRNYLYDIGKRPSVKFNLPVISVGNLSVGGTGKTPHVEYLVRLLKDSYRLAILSRGYGRKTKGFILAGEDSNAKTIGDEPYQYYRKFGQSLTVAVGEERAMAIPSILFDRPDVQVVILDDAFQHRAVSPSFSILLTDFSHPFFEDFLLPFGRLREARKNVNRAKVIIVTKCPDALSEKERVIEEAKIKRYHSLANVFFTGIRYGKIHGVFKKETMPNKKVILFTGLANPIPLEAYITDRYQLVCHRVFKDHHDYREKDLIDLITLCNTTDECMMVTSEKDMVKLVDKHWMSFFKETPLFYIPIEPYFLDKKEQFDGLVKKSLLF